MQVNAGQRITAGVLSEDYSLTDLSTFPVTGTSATDISKSWSIPANDANVGTCYRLSVHGNGTQGSTAQTLTLNTVFGGSAVGSNPSIGSTQFSINAIFRWDMTVTLVCFTTGAGATWQVGMLGAASQTSNNILATTGDNGSIGWSGGTSATFVQDSTVSNVLKIRAFWSSTTGAPTVSSKYSIFERLGG